MKKVEMDTVALKNLSERFNALVDDLCEDENDVDPCLKARAHALRADLYCALGLEPLAEDMLD